MTTKTELDHQSYWNDGYTWEEYSGTEIEEHQALWDGIYGRHETPEWALEKLRDLGGEWKLLVITEDWCGDASNSVPVLARLAENAPSLDLRLVKRDENTELMDRYLTDGGRAIPVAIVLDTEFEPVGWWGPRPAELQEFVIGEKQKDERPVADIYRDTRKWYARDKGETILRELLQVIEGAA